jgi:hypothetical protein
MWAKTVLLNEPLEVATIEEEEDSAKDRSLRNTTDHSGEEW